MTAPRRDSLRVSDPAGREIARGLVEAVRHALEPGATSRARDVARDVAEVLGLDGLAEVLAELNRDRAGDRPADLGHVEARLARLAAEAEAARSAAPFREADAELAAHSRALRETEWAGEGAAAVPVYGVAEVLADLPLEPDADLSRARVTAPVAASLRAALDWIGADEALVVQAAFHDSALALTCPVSHAGGLAPAGAVLATVEGSLGPESDGRWTLRVPLHVERPSFLLVRIGHVPVALPWHSVARLRMHSPADWEALGEPVLAPLAPPAGGGDERPGALVALGLTRAWLVADRIVWRIATNAEESADRGPFGVSTRAVRVESGERYWVLEPAWLLRATLPIAVAPPAPRPRPGTMPVGEPEVQMAAAQAAAMAEAPRRPAAAPATEADVPPAQLSLADAVARAIERLRGEREAAAAPASRPESLPAVVEPRLTVLRPADVTPLERASVAPAAATDSPPPGTPETVADAGAAPPPVDTAVHPVAPDPVAPVPVAPDPVAPDPIAFTEPAAPHATPEMAEPAPAAATESRVASAESHASAATTDAAPADPLAAPAESHAAPATPTADVRTLAPAPHVAPAAAAPAPADGERPSQRMSMPGRRALVADDSLVARIFLARLLERRGYFVELVGDGESMWQELSHGPWALVCADVTMPDSHGRAHVERLLDFGAACREPFRLIVLTRDAAEEREAALAGAPLHLRKPFDPAALDELLQR